ncbi:uncharacterized protein FMAN_15371 [Fusarium mangiferae]|uniref:RelA/SpoT domain-containing protein n=1 Tax=Fusarium mangiferae TaxID=192010 RepID=A0A1L7U9A0_FUSMA|nr:uncharacterized protein FMAN_15371 [Fusarium mangiferae]CVL07284.1 uncharacterized protein FMAN_15371 [Fusarium mangiferae]
MDGRVVTDSSSGRDPSTTGDPNQSMPLRARILHLVEESSSRNGYTGQNVKEIFLEQIWPKLESDYQRMSDKLAKACKVELSNRRVPIPVTVEHRVKSRTSISKSLQRREIHRAKENLGMYKSLHDILGDLHDLVGIRIIVEYLDHLKDVSQFVAGSFNQEKEPNRFDANRKVGHLWQPWFGAYECMNYHISSKYAAGNRLSPYNGVMFEIQVTSLPAHMYNKIAHPLLYKEEAGTLSQGDEMVIDITKGLAYCYSLCLHFKRSKLKKPKFERSKFKRSKLSGDVEEQEDMELLRNIPSAFEELDESSLNRLAERIPKLDVAASKTMDIPRESLRLALDSLLNDQMPDDIGQALADRFSREIENIAQPPINLVTSGNARFDSQDVHSSPVCQAGTQTRALQYIHDWINDSEKALLWIYSHAGTGKSTLARTIARKLTETSQIAAGYFFKRGDSNRNDVSRVFPTIASQLMSTIPRYEPFLRKSVTASKNPDIKTMRLDEQFKVLIKVPLSAIGIIPSTKVIIVDALDECTNLIEASKIIKLLCSLRDSKNLRFRLVVTSRDESLVRKAIENQLHESLQLATTFRNDNISDIRSILRLGFEEIRKETEIKHAWPTDEQFEVILQRSINPSPLFIYAATFLRFLDEGKDMCTSEKRLQWWIDQSPSTAGMSQLEGLYTTVFENLDRNKKDGTSGLLTDEEKSDLRTVLGTVVLAVEPLSIEAIASISRVDLGTTRGLLKCCRAVLEISDDNQKPVKAVHKSFGDFLLRKHPLKRSWFHADEMESHDHVAEGCMSLLQTLRKDICDFNDPGISRESIDAHTIDSHIPKSLQYASSYWWHHLQRGNKRDHSYECLIQILKSHFLHWIECLSILNRLPFASRAVGELCASLIMLLYQDKLLTDVQRDPCESMGFLIPFLKDASRFILRHGNTIQENPLQTYGAALLFSPAESLIRRSFWETRHPGFKVIRNLEHHWGACLKEVEDLSRISSISLSHDGQELAMAGATWDTEVPSIWIRDTGAGTLLAQFNTHTQLLALTWSSDGNSLLAVTRFGQVVRIDRAIETESPFGFSPFATTERYDYAAICSSGIASVVRVSHDDFNHDFIKSEVFTWGFTQRDQTFRTWEFPDSTVPSMALSPDGSLLALSVVAWFPGHHQYRVRVIEVNTGTCIQDLAVYARSLAFSLDGCRLFISDSNLSTLTVLKFPSGTCEHLRLPKAFVANAMAILPDYTTILTKTDYKLRYLDLEALNYVIRVPKQPDPRRLDDGYPIKRVAISPSGRFMITSSVGERSLKVWRLPDAILERCLTVDSLWEDNRWSFTQLRDASNDKEAFILHQDEVAYIWFLEGIENTQIKHSRVVKLPMGDLYFSSIRAHRTAVLKFGLWNLSHRPQGVNVSMTDGRMAAVSFKDTVKVVELGSTASLCFDFKEPGNHTISAIALSPSSTYFAISYGTTISIWTLADPSTTREVRTNDEVKSLVFSPDESLLVYNTGNSIWSCTMSDQPRCLLQNSGIVFPSEPCFSSSGQILAWLVDQLYGYKKQVYVWNTSSDLQLPTFEVSYEANAISFSKDDQILYVLGRIDTLETYQFEQQTSQLGSIGGLGLTCDKRIELTSRWISCNGQKLLVIPEEYYIYRIEYSSNFLAIKIHHQGIIILDFN